MEREWKCWRHTGWRGLGETREEEKRYRAKGQRDTNEVKQRKMPA